ncbi:hypothetical protein Ciccas_012316 [Cichlidogyrus casuarinus]|uniref:Neurotransmitter-gated ion-channel ligand-binding domain-containing protein n=1 Tax=Cichlidogyrus casuarinus TaxID=1844966 RepID=A0ABD2PNR5_9PLAT
MNGLIFRGVFLYQLVAVLADFKIESQFKNQLLNDYDPSARPIRNSKQPIDVSIQLLLRQIVDLDEKNQILVSAMLIRLVWTDEQLVWSNTANSSKLPKRIILPYQRVWTPDLYIYNNVASSKSNQGFLNVNGSQVLIHENGVVHWNLPITVQSSCLVDVLYFPFDHQVCEIQIASWTYDEAQLKLHVEVSLQTN